MDSNTRIFQQYTYGRSLKYANHKLVLSDFVDSGMAIEEESRFVSQSTEMKHIGKLIEAGSEVFKDKNGLKKIESIFASCSKEAARQNMIFNGYIKHKCDYIEISKNRNKYTDMRKFGMVNICITNKNGRDFFCEELIFDDIESNVEYVCRSFETIISQAHIGESFVDNFIMDNAEVLFTHATAGYLVHETIGHTLESDILRANLTDQRVNCMSDSIGPTNLSVVDGIADIRGNSIIGSIDDEGTPTKSILLVSEGFIRNEMCDIKHQNGRMNPLYGCGRRESYRYRVLPRMRNTYICPDADIGLPQLIKKVKNGVVVTQLNSGNVSIVNGSFNLRGRGYLIKDGASKCPIEDMEINGSARETVKNIKAIGNDFESSFNQCHKNGQTIPVLLGSPTVWIGKLSVNGALYG